MRFARLAAGRLPGYESGLEPITDPGSQVGLCPGLAPRSRLIPSGPAACCGGKRCRMISYYGLGPDKRLNEIVFAGSHDAGITSGASNIKTQGFDILQQARAGVRIFDIRIAAQSVAVPGGPKRAELRAFHSAVTSEQSKFRVVGGKMREVQRSKMGKGIGNVRMFGGDWGSGLSEILRDARDFVRSSEGGSEFLILKFDKCKNWELIREACSNTLSTFLYREGGNLNTKKLKDLKGRVIVLFSHDGWVQAKQPRPSDGILRFKNLQAQGVHYEPNFDGLQYLGKGGTSVTNPGWVNLKIGGKRLFKTKLKENMLKQSKLMRDARALANPDIMGMMYWTTTGLIESIKKRDDGMWEPPNVQKLHRVWAGGLGDFVAGPGNLRKRFLPNIVMIDFADARKCAHIYILNLVTERDIARLLSN